MLHKFVDELNRMSKHCTRSKRIRTPSSRLRDYDENEMKPIRKLKQVQNPTASEQKSEPSAIKKRKTNQLVSQEKPKVHTLRPYTLKLYKKASHQESKAVTFVGAIDFYDPAFGAHMGQLEKDSGMVMLGEAHEKAKWPVLVTKSHPDYGFSLVAKWDIKKNEVIVPYLGVKIAVSDDDELTEQQSTYAFKLDENYSFFAHERASVAAFVNHNFSIPNVQCVKEKDKLTFKALSDIPAGCALLINYGIHYKFNNQTLYLSPYNNGKSPKENWEQYNEFYDQQPIELSQELKNLFKINATHCVVPKIVHNSDLLHGGQKHKYKAHQNLPIYLVSLNRKLNILEEQPFISPLMFVCAQKNAQQINKLLQNDADVFAETRNHLSVLGIVSSTLSLEDSNYGQAKGIFISILNRIYKKYKEAYFVKELKETYTKESLLDAIKEKFIAYINQHVDNPIALELINDEYPQISLQAMDTRETSPARAKVPVQLETDSDTAEVSASESESEAPTLPRQSKETNQQIEPGLLCTTEMLAGLGIFSHNSVTASSNSGRHSGIKRNRAF